MLNSLWVYAQHILSKNKNTIQVLDSDCVNAIDIDILADEL